MLMEVKCKDDPEAEGKVPKVGDTRYTLIFPLEYGNELKLHLGQESFNHFVEFITQMVIDDSGHVYDREYRL